MEKQAASPIALLLGRVNFADEQNFGSDGRKRIDIERRIYRHGDKYTDVETYTFLRRDGSAEHREIVTQRSASMVYGFCREYFGKSPEECWCEFRSLRVGR